MLSDLVNQCCGENSGLLFLIAIILLIVWNGVITVLLWKSLSFSKKLFGDTKREDLKEILQEHIGRVGAVQVRLNDLEKMVAQIEHKGRRHISKVGIVRYNPFDDTGGDQSFVVALLDDADDGVVISSMHGRHRTRMYSKPVRGGEPTDYEFSDEEQEAIRKARALGHK